MFEYTTGTISEKAITIAGIPCCVFTPKGVHSSPQAKLPTIFYYHTKTSNASSEVYSPLSVFKQFSPTQSTTASVKPSTITAQLATDTLYRPLCKTYANFSPSKNTPSTNFQQTKTALQFQGTQWAASPQLAFLPTTPS